MRSGTSCTLICLSILAITGSLPSTRAAIFEPTAPLIRSARSGPWSASATWEGGRVPGAGARGVPRRAAEPHLAETGRAREGREQRGAPGGAGAGLARGRPSHRHFHLAADQAEEDLPADGPRQHADRGTDGPRGRRRARDPG